MVRATLGKPPPLVKGLCLHHEKNLCPEEPVTHIGKQLNLPYTADGSINEGKALKSILHPVGI